MTIYTVGSHNPDPGTALMFCNGVANTLEDAQALAGLISRYFDDKKITGIYNPATLLDYLNPSKSLATIRLFEKVLRNHIPHDKNIRSLQGRIHILIFVHCHGAYIAKRALLNFPHKEIVEIYSFGGAVMIPRELNAQNFLRENDTTAQLSNSLLDKEFDEPVYEYAKNLHTAKKRVPDELQAIEFAAIQSYKKHLLARVHTGSLQAFRRYQDIYILGHGQPTAEDLPFLSRKIIRHLCLNSQYAIHFLEGFRLAASPESSPIKTGSVIPIFKRTTFPVTMGFIERSFIEAYGNKLEEVIRERKKRFS